MRVEEKDGKVLLLLDLQDEINTLFHAFNSLDKETAHQHKLRLGNLLDPLLKGRKIDEIQNVFADYGTGEILDYYTKNTFDNPTRFSKYKNYERTLIDLISYVSDARREQLMSKNKVIRDFLRKNYDRVVGELNTAASEFRTQDRNAKVKAGIQVEAERRGLGESTSHSEEVLPPSGYPAKKYGARRSRVAHSRPVRRTRKRKVTLRTVGL